MNTDRRYDAVALALHWSIALLALVQLALGWWMIDIPKTPVGVRAAWFNLHKSIGLTIGLLMLARLGWRLVHATPGLPGWLPRWQARVARASHALLYGALIVQPLVGYLGSSFTSYPILYFGRTLPHWGWDSPALKALCSEVHLALAGFITALVALHIAAALRHLVRRDGVFDRMWPKARLAWGRRRGISVRPS